MGFSYRIDIPQIFTLEWFSTSWGCLRASRALQNIPSALAENRTPFPAGSVGISQNPGGIWVDFAGKHSGSSCRAGRGRSLVPGDSRGHGLAPAHWPPSHSSEPTSLHPGHSLGLPTLFQKASSSGFIVKPQKRSLFHLGHDSEPTGQHHLHSRFSSGFPNYFIDSGIFQGINIILLFGGKMRFPSLPPASLPVLHHCCLRPGCRTNPLSPGTSRGLRIRISFLSAANSHREGWEWEQAGRELKAPSRIIWSLTTSELQERFGAAKVIPPPAFPKISHCQAGLVQHRGANGIDLAASKPGKAFLLLPAVPLAHGKLSLQGTAWKWWSNKANVEMPGLKEQRLHHQE